MQKDDDPVQEVAQAAVLYTKARDHFHDVLRKYVDNHLKSDLVDVLFDGGPLVSSARGHATESTAKKVAEKSAVMTDDLRAMGISPKTQPLGNVTRVVVRGLLSTFKERVLFTAKDAAVCRPAPHNTRDGVHSALACLVRRGLIKDEGDGCFSIPDARKLEAALIISAKAALFPD